MYLIKRKNVMSTSYDMSDSYSIPSEVTPIIFPFSFIIISRVVRKYTATNKL